MVIIIIIIVLLFLFWNTKLRIPRTIVMTTKDKSVIPSYILDQYRTYAPEYQLTIFDDGECREFLKRNYEPKVLRKFDLLEVGAHKADLFRYAYLYKHGGCYIDVKTLLVRPLRDFIDHNRSRLCMVKSVMGKSIYNGFIVTPPGNPIMKEMLDEVVDDNNPDKSYLRFTISAYKVLEQYYSLRVGLNQDLMLWREKPMSADMCNGQRDKWGWCMGCVDAYGNLLFKVRDPTYGKTWS